MARPHQHVDTFASVDLGVVNGMTKDFHAWLAEACDESSVRINHLIRMVATCHNCSTSAATFDTSAWVVVAAASRKCCSMWDGVPALV